MKALRFIAVFIEIVVKECKKSPIIVTILIILSGVAAIIYIPHWTGLLVMLVFENVFPPPAWVIGALLLLIFTIMVVLIDIIFIEIYRNVRYYIKHKAGRTKWYQ